jgi:hypothetical protein
MCDEMENFVLDAGLTLDAGSETTADPNPTQLSQALYMAARDGDAFTDSGAANAYVLTKIRGKEETAYRNGARFRFVPANTNTGASTVNIQGIGSKNIRFADNSVLAAGSIISGAACQIYYDLSADNFKLLSNGVPYSGTYTGVLTNGANVSASSFVAANFIRVNNQVQVFFQISVTNTSAGGTISTLEMTLPVSSNLSSANDLNGTGTKNNSTPSHCVIYGSAANDKAVIQYNCQTAATESIFGQFMYTVK